jgi:hypothetical protein
MADDPKPVAATDEPKPVLNAEELQAKQVKKLTPDERKAADDAHFKAKKLADETHHANRIKTAHAHHKALADKLFIEKREITITRKAEPDDIGYSDTLACSVVKFTDTEEERVVLDSAIQTKQSA